MPELDNRIFAPFTQEQQDNLNAWQNLGMMHPFTCPDHSDTPLEAHEDGWSCPHSGGFSPIDVRCDYTQNWAHKFMADPSVITSMINNEQKMMSAFFDQNLHKRMGAAKMRDKNPDAESPWNQKMLDAVQTGILESNAIPWPDPQLIPADRYAQAALDAYRAYQIEVCCEVMHDAYEKAALGAGWVTNPESRKPWADVPVANQETMRAAVGALIKFLGVL